MVGDVLVSISAHRHLNPALSPLSSPLNQSQHSLQGVTSPVIRLGGAGTPYGWKTGVHDTAGIHFNHTGGPIVWYAFAQKYTAAFLEAVQSIVRPEVDPTDSPSPLTADISDIDDVKAQLQTGNWMLRPETLVTKGVPLSRRGLSNFLGKPCTLFRVCSSVAFAWDGPY